MIVNKKANEYGSSDFYFINYGVSVSIMQTGDDHTLIARYQNLAPIDKLNFIITESDNFEVYKLFCKLYERITSGNVMDWDLNRPDTLEKMETERSTSWYKKTVQDGVISIMSDAYPVRCPNTLTIRREPGAIILGFDKVDGRDFGEYKSKYDITINVRQSGSRIYDLAFPFRKLFQELQSMIIEEVPFKKLSTK